MSNARGQVLYVEDFGRSEDGSSLSARMGFCYDIAGNRIKKMDLNGASPSCPSSTAGVAVPAKDASGNNIAFWRFDAFGRLKKSSDPDFGVSGFEYNEFGDLISNTDARGLVTGFEYDRLGRMISKVLPGTEGIVTYTYDALAGSDNGLGRLVALDDPSQFKQFSYDVLGRRKKEIRRLKNPDTGDPEEFFETNFRYDLLERTIEIDYPKDPNRDFAVRACYGYNSFGFVNSVQSDAVGPDAGCADRVIVSSISYNEFGQMTQLVWGNGIITDYDYDIKGRLSRLLSSKDNQGQIEKLQDVNYSFNILNSIKKIQNTSTEYESTFEYKYDGLNRLIAAEGRVESEKLKEERVKSHDTADCDFQLGNCNYSRQYNYAQNGNLTAKEILDPVTGALRDRWAYSYSNHAVTQIQSSAHGAVQFEMQYDASGNMTAQRDYKKSLYKQMSYDSYNRIRNVENPDTGEVIGRYFYDDQGFRVRRIARYEEEDRTRDVELKYLNKYFAIELSLNSAGNVNQRRSSSVNNIYLNGVRIAAIDHEGRGRYYLTDQVDSVKIITNDTGDAVSRFEYMPYGETFIQEGQLKYAPKYNSQELDKETNYYFYNARHYDPEIARFVTADAVIDGALDTVGWNRYTYVRGNPVVYRDPTGHRVDQYTKHVVFDKHHSWLIATPENQKDFKEYFNKENIDSGKVLKLGTKENPKYAFIFRAGPEADGIKAITDPGKLDNTKRLENDPKATRTSSTRIEAPKDKNGKPISDTQFIDRLFKADKKYSENLKLRKNEMPDYPEGAGVFGRDKNEYNSNSFTSGLLKAVGANPVEPKIEDEYIDPSGPRIVRTKGEATLYDMPVPKEFFE